MSNEISLLVGPLPGIHPGCQGLRRCRGLPSPVQSIRWICDRM